MLCIIIPLRASLLLLILLWVLYLFASTILLYSVTMLVFLTTFWTTCLCYALLNQCLLDFHQLRFWIYVIYLILYELFVSTISFKPVKNYHTVLPSCTAVFLEHCGEFVMFSARFASIAAAIGCNLGMDVFFFRSRALLEKNHCVVHEFCWIITYATELIMLASPNKWSSISLIFSWTLVIDLDIST